MQASFETLELRWFFDDEPVELAGWFEGTPREPARTDWYFPCGRGDLGIKVRVAGDAPPRGETKFLVGALPDLALAERASGVLERWTKVSLELAPAERRAVASWIEVRKARRLRLLAFEDGALTEVAPGTRLVTGCGVELTEVTLAGGRAWTFGLEAFGPSSPRLEALRAAVGRVVRERPALVLQARASRGYPAWLTTARASSG